ncbi:MAG: DUF2948 family protein [Hyphomonadaceae bacterium]|nr:DUF2948 family protein [Hyphomonadaceae bacterium]
MGSTLRLRAEDADDLAVIAAALQDSIFVVRDLSFDARGRRFVASVNRFRWEAAGKQGPFQRVRAALSVETVLGVRSRKLRLGADDAAGSILDVRFTPGPEAPAGVIGLTLGGGGEIALEVECIDVTLTDLGDPWPTPHRPDHERP